MCSVLIGPPLNLGCGQKQEKLFQLEFVKIVMIKTKENLNHFCMDVRKRTEGNTIFYIGIHNKKLGQKTTEGFRGLIAIFM